MYNRLQSEKMLIEKYGYQSCGEKHCENIFTNWYMNFYLYQKYGIDKRKAHYSSLINAGQMTREDALFLLQANPVYPSLGIERKVLEYKKRSHEEFKQDIWFNKIATLVRFVKKLARVQL